MCTKYDIKLSYGETLTILADFSDAASEIHYFMDDGEIVQTPFQVGDTRHSVETAAVRVLKWFGSDHWLDQEDDIGDIEDIDAHLRGLVLSWTAIQEGSK